MDDASYVSMVEDLASSVPTTTMMVPESLLFFVRFGAVPFVNGGLVAAALGVTMTELDSLLPRCGEYGAWLCEFDDLWDDLISLAESGYPGAARLWLVLYRDHGMPLVDWE